MGNNCDASNSNGEGSGFDALLERKAKGSLKVYLGYAAGVGKTFAMLQEGHRLKARGFDVVIGYVEPHERVDTQKLVEGLEEIPPRFLSSHNQRAREMDLKQVLERKPKVALIDELAHSNIEGSKNEKRFQDVLEILDQGINVITTLNVQHLESVAERVSETLRVPVSERLPDYILQRADQIVNVDVTIDDLRERLRIGKIYEKTKAEKALLHFFTHDNLSFLRKLSLQEAVGDQLRKIEEQKLLADLASSETMEAVMVALSSDPTHASILIRKGAKMAAQFSSRCYVVYIQKGSEAPNRIDSTLQRKLLSNLKLAKMLGAEVITLEGENVADTLVNFAQSHHVRHAIFGKSRLSPIRERIRGSVLLAFIHDSVGIDVHVVSFGSESEEDLQVEVYK